MIIDYGVKGHRRKELAQAVSNNLNTLVKYMGAPSFSYQVGAYQIDKEGTLEGPDNRELITGLHSFVPEREEYEVDLILIGPKVETLNGQGFEVEPPSGITIEIPLDGFTEQSMENLKKLIASKANLIKKAIGTDSLELERTKTTLRFPWFPMASSNEVDAYYLFVEGLCKTAKDRKRVTAKERDVGNEKFAFRVFLIQLGFLGDEYKQARKILLKNLVGNSAFRDKAEVAKNA